MDMDATTMAQPFDLGVVSSDALTAFGAAQPKPSRFDEFPFIAVEDLEYQPPEYLVDGLIETDSVGMIFGESTHGKSFLAIDLALCVATGSEFHGRKVKPGKVFFLAGEGHNGLGRRICAWEKHRGIARSGMFISKKPAQLLDALNAELVGDVMTEIAAERGQPALIIIDTLDKNFGPGDENSTSDMKDFMARVNELRSQFPGCTTLTIHHPGHGDKTRGRGASNLPAGLDLNSRVERHGDEITWTINKMKDGEIPDPISFEMVRVELDHGVTSIVLRETNPTPKQPRLTKAQVAAREAYIDAAAASGIWEGRDLIGLSIEHWRASFYASHLSENVDTKRKAFNRARDELLQAGKISMVDNDTCLWNEPAIPMLINQRRTSGTSGTNRDNVTECPGAEAG